MSAQTQNRSPVENGSQDGAVSLLAGIVTDPNEELPTSKRGRQAAPVMPEYAATFAALIEGTVRALIWPAKGDEPNADAVTLLKRQATKYFSDSALANGKRPAYTTVANGKDGEPTRVCFEVKSKN